jgi:digeranylgeranylglycerophospholipid reductase
MSAVLKEACDVLVVGAGPAGSTAALAAAAAGADVALIDRRSEIGTPVQCAELIPAPLLREVPVTSASIVQRTRGIVTHLPNGETDEADAPGVMLDRASFDSELAVAAACAGTRLATGTRLVGMREGAAVVEGPRGEATVRARVVVGADGPLSAVGESVWLRNVSFAAAKQVKTLLAEPLDTTHVFFDQLYRGGYGWLFPKGETANLGVAVERSSGHLLDEALDHLTGWVLELGLTVGRHVLDRTGGLIPVGGPLGEARAGNVLLVGDAAGQTHPMTGAGIHAAVSCGRAAGRCAAAFAASGDETDLTSYVDAWRRDWRDVLRTASRRRAELMERWDTDFAAAVRRCWVVFPEYYA